MEKKRKLEEYRLTHEGELPPLSFCEKIYEKLTGHSKYDMLDGDQASNQMQVMKQAALGRNVSNSGNKTEEKA